MKNIITLTLLAFSFLGCEKSLIDQLPPATQEGKNTIGCIINGKVYNTYNETGNNITCYNECQIYEGGLNGSHIASTMCKNNGYGGIYIYIYDSLEEGKTYLIGEPISGNAYAECTSSLNTFETNLNSTGSLTITKLSATIIAGTFNFTAKANPAISEDSAATIMVTEGRFDLWR